MGLDLSKLLVVAVSSRALFDLEEEARIYERLGLGAYQAYQLDNEKELLRPGTAFSLVKGLLSLNKADSARRVEVIVVSHNNPETGLRVFHSIQHFGLDITRAAFVGSEPLLPYLETFNADLLLSPSIADVQAAIDADVPAAIVYRPPNEAAVEFDELRIAFDADAVLFSEESEALYRAKGIDAFLAHEKENADQMLAAGPLARLLIKLGGLQKSIATASEAPFKIAIVTARNSPAHERVIKTLRAWGVRADAAFFLGGVGKAAILKAYGAHIFFDDQEAHLAPAALHTPCALVPYKTASVLRPPPPSQSDRGAA
jgi:5'-nucleotidase